jgi:hypothetical protein
VHLLEILTQLQLEQMNRLGPKMKKMVAHVSCADPRKLVPLAIFLQLDHHQNHQELVPSPVGLENVLIQRC